MACSAWYSLDLAVPSGLPQAAAIWGHGAALEVPQDQHHPMLDARLVEGSFECIALNGGGLDVGPRWQAGWQRPTARWRCPARATSTPLNLAGQGSPRVTNLAGEQG